MVKQRKQSEGASESGTKKRKSYDAAFKLRVVEAALQRPASNRIKPTCALYPGIQPCQLRNWIRHFENDAAVERVIAASSSRDMSDIATADAECGAADALHALRMGLGGGELHRAHVARSEDE